MPVPLKKLSFDILRLMFVWMLQSAESQVLLAILNTLDFRVRFLPSCAE